MSWRYTNWQLQTWVGNLSISHDDYGVRYGLLQSQKLVTISIAQEMLTLLEESFHTARIQYTHRRLR